MSHAILLTGQVGSGKTTVAIEMGEMLEAAGEPHAVIDLDWLAWVRPGTAVSVEALLTDNLRAVWSTFREAGVERLVLARQLESAGQLASVREALEAVELFVVRLEAPRDVLEQRLRRRDTGAQLDDHLARAAGPDPGPPADAVAAAHGRPVADIAAEILSVAGW